MHPLEPLHVAVLHGGPSTEHDISVWSSRGVVDTLRGARHRVVPVYVDRQGRWHFGTESSEVAAMYAEGLSLPQALQRMMDLGFDIAFLGFHGTYGEDGKVQAALDLCGIRYTGSGSTASAVAMDKPLARRVYAGVGLPIAKAVELPATGLDDLTTTRVEAARIAAKLRLPVVVKVPAGGSSVGVEIARSEEQLADVLVRLGAGQERLLCEQFIAGTEITVGVLEQPDGQLEVLPVVEIAPVKAEFFDYQAKYTSGGTDEIVPARISATATHRAQQLGLAAHRALGCAGVSRTDMIVSADDEPILLETNTLPGLTPASLLPKAAAATGLSYEQLLHRILAAALR